MQERVQERVPGLGLVEEQKPAQADGERAAGNGQA